MTDLEQHHDWQVVLVQPSQRKVVLFHPVLNELQVGSSSPVPSHPPVPPRRRSRRRSNGRDRSTLATGEVQVEQLDSDDDSDPTPPGRESPTPNLCPLCYTPLNRSNRPSPTPRQRVLPLPPSRPVQSQTTLRRIPSYFQLLSEANSLANTPTTTRESRATASQPTGPPLDQSQFNEGYFAKFFEEIQLLGKGGQGVVYLVRHLLNGEALGLYACKKSELAFF